MKFTLYWRYSDGRQVIEGDNIVDAMNMAGIGAGALPALDFYANGEDNEWKWDSKMGMWVKKEGETN